MGRTLPRSLAINSTLHFNSLAPCGANLIALGDIRGTNEISTHSPRVGRTSAIKGIYYGAPNFNSLAPCGANLLRGVTDLWNYAFQLTRPVWGEPLIRQRLQSRFPISTHSPRVGRTKFFRKHCYAVHHFNSLAPCGANRPHCTPRRDRLSFQLTRPVWGEPIS